MQLRNCLSPPPSALVKHQLVSSGPLAKSLETRYEVTPYSEAHQSPRKSHGVGASYPRVAEVLMLCILYVIYVLIIFERLTRGISELRHLVLKLPA